MKTMVLIGAALLVSLPALGCAESDDPPGPGETQTVDGVAADGAKGLGETMIRDKCCICTADSGGECTGWECYPGPDCG